MEFVSITGGGQAVDFETAILQGKAVDGGLFVPTNLPIVTSEQLNRWKKLSYPELAFEILQLFIPQQAIPSQELKSLIAKSFSNFFTSIIIPHYTLKSGKNLIIQELFHGPTLSFKDVAMGFVVNLFDYFLQRKGERMTIMVATSGDTGPAAAAASRSKLTLKTWLFYPVGMITEEQRRQMTSILDENVFTVAIENCTNGSDELDELIAGCFSDEPFRKEMNLSSVNSINWARVMMQVVHYFYGYLQNVHEVGERINFSVPCGAFGNMCAGTIARMMGLPINKMIVSTNSNTALFDAFEKGILAKNDIIANYSSAIDISVPMNFWRYLYFVLGEDEGLISKLYEQYESTGSIKFSREQHDLFKAGFVANSISNEETLQTIKTIYNSEKYLLDPHGAVAVASAMKSEDVLGNFRTICLATAHPAKFPDVTKKAVQTIPEIGKHQSLEEAKLSCEKRFSCKADIMYEAIPKLMRKLNGQNR